MVTYFKSQNDLAKALMEVIDAYWAGKINDKDFIEVINELVSKNSEKFYRNNEYSVAIVQRLGKKRIGLLNKILNIQ